MTLRARLSRAPWPLLVVVLVAAIVLAAFALSVHLVQADEDLHVQLGRYIFGRDFPGGLFEVQVYTRGLQRLYVWLIGPPLALFSSPRDLQIAHIVSAFAFACTAIPAYALARELGLGTWLATLIAALVLVVPWSVVSTAFLTENLAYPLATATLWATVRACVRPGWRGDLLALVLLGLTTLTRVNLAVLVVPLLAATLLQELRFGDGLRGLPRRYGRAHPLLAAVLVAGLLGTLLYVSGAFSVTSLAGTYSSSFVINWSQFFGRLDRELSRIAVGTGFIAFAVGFPWLLREAFRPREPRTFAFAVAALLGGIGILFTTYRTGYDERYLIYLGPPLFLAVSLAVTRLPIGWPLIGLGGAFTLWLVLHHGWSQDPGIYAVFTYPAEAFYGRIVLGKLGAHAPLGLSGEALVGILVVVALLAVVAVRYAGRRAFGLAVAVLAGLALYQLAQTAYAVHGYTGGLAGRPGADQGPGYAQRAIIDRHRKGGETSAINPVSSSNGPTYNFVWGELAFWNHSLHRVYTLDEQPRVSFPLGWTALRGSVDARTGRITGDQPPDVLAQIRAYRNVDLVTTPAASSKYLPLDLVRVVRPARARYVIGGPDPDGWLLKSTDRGVARIWGGDLPPKACAAVGLVAPAGAYGTKPYRVEVGKVVRRGRVGPGPGKAVSVPLPAGMSSRNRTATLTVKAGRVTPLGDGRTGTLNIAGFSVGPCPS